MFFGKNQKKSISLPQAVLIKGKAFPLDIKISNKTCHIFLKFSSNGQKLILSLPRKRDLPYALYFLKSKQGWIERQASSFPEIKVFIPQMEIFILGQRYEIQHCPDQKGGVWISDTFLCVSGEKDHLHRRVKDFAYQLFLSFVKEKALLMAEELQVDISRISLRDTSSRWGSCSSNGTLCFSWRLVFAPLEVAEYVIAHEVAHLVELNHSPAFWAIVRKLCHDRVVSSKKWLKEHGHELHCYV